jgi:Phage tail sheath protein subtilisin-like domain/Phage tail sheath C-terminal domain
MAIRTIQSAGVEIRETDLSLRIPRNVGTNIYVAGFTPQGPVDEVLSVSSREELETIYGIPTNSAERYFYYTVRELLNSPATIYTFRLPYGAGTGDGFGTQHSALVYPVRSYVPSTSAVTTSLDLSAAVYVLGEPVHVNLTEDQYANALEGTLFDWSATGSNAAQLSSVTALGGAGVIVLDKAQTTINSQFEGYYVGIADNTNINPASNFDSITRANTLSLTSNYVGLSGGTTYTQIPNGTLQFNLSSAFLDSNGNTTGIVNSVSQIMENLTDYNIDGREDDDLLSVGVFKIRKSIYATESFKLDFVVDDAIVGSIDSFRTELNPSGGASVPFFLEAKDTNSRNVEILVNPYISNKFTTSSQDSAGLPQKKVRVLTQGLVNTNPTNFQATGLTTGALTAIAAQIGYADALYPLGAYSPVTITQKTVGNVPTKINRALEAVKNDEIYDIDVVVEAGLGTIFTMASAAGTSYYDDTLYNSALKAKVDTLRTSNDIAFTDGADLRANYSAVFNQFENFCNLPSNTGGRGDCIFVADPIRHILVTGKNTKILSDKTKSFQQHVYWAIRHQFELENTSYAATYGNWVQVYDEFTGEKMWQPFSGFAAAVMARSDAAEFPWSAPAGFNRGLLTTSALDLAVNPNQKQRDEFYKNNVNPVMFSPSQGMVIFGQKTLSRKPSAFDRINVRRLFLALERPTKKASAFYLFEPNNEFTQTRFKNTLTPLFEFAKQNGGLYDYEIIVDNRVNTPQVIDDNELRATIFISPTRTAEFIVVEFVSTATGASFQELL